MNLKPDRNIDLALEQYWIRTIEQLAGAYVRNARQTTKKMLQIDKLDYLGSHVNIIQKYVISLLCTTTFETWKRYNFTVVL